MKHLIVCREYPPAPYPPGGIGTYVRHLARLLAESGEIVHIVAQRWEGAPRQVTESCGGRLVVHRVSLHEVAGTVTDRNVPESRLLSGLAVSDCPSQAFSWQVAKIIESLVQSEMIDVIEAPEWEAPLYYFQIRRAIGLGPSRQPPCLIHLHSPSELIFRHNQWDVTLSDYQPLRRLEEYTVKAADAVLCPSHYLAHEAGRLFGLADDAIRVIPYPLGDTTPIMRDRKIWERDAICYAGRLELRKGVVEWVDAAVEVAQSHSKVEFEFVGSDTSLSGGAGRSVRDYLNDRIPRSLRSRFHFYGSQTRGKLMELLSKVPMAVVPSRWENLPYSCIEAMCTGLPVLASPTGGMAELLTDGESGWVAADGTASGLASALRRMLDTSPFERARMGGEAERAVRRICSNESVLERHLELRRRLALTGAMRSRQVPSSTGSQRVDADRRGIGVVVTCLDRLDLLPACLQSIRRQTQQASVVVVASGSHPEVAELIEPNALQGAPVVWVNAPSAGLARDLAVQRILCSIPLVRGIAFLSEGARLEPHYLSACESVLELQPGVGVVSSIVRYDDGPGIELDAAPSPASSQVPLDFDTLACVAVRAEALQAAPGAGESWAAVTYPDLMVSATRPAHPATNVGRPKRYSAMALAQRGSAQITLNWFLAAPLAEKARWIGKVLKQPLRTAQWAAWQLRVAAGRAE